MWALIGLFAGAFIGNSLWHEWGAALGAIAGFLAGVKVNAIRRTEQKRAELDASAQTTARSMPGVAPPAESARPLLQRIEVLERRVEMLEHALFRQSTTPATDRPEAAAKSAQAMSAASGASSDEAIDAPGRSHIESPAQSEPISAWVIGGNKSGADDVPSTFGASPQPSMAAAAASEPNRATSNLNPLWIWFTGANALTRIGVVVVFFGVVFLLKYFAEHFTMPIEVRLAAVAAGGCALIAVGIFLRASRPGYALSLQGAGAGVLYLTTFAAFKLYGVLPQLSTIALLTAVSALTVWLAARNDSQPLAGLAIAGGFLSPMLVDTGGDPLPLFAYFALLNGAILTLAWMKAWRVLNGVGFVFTFVLGAIWGHEFYDPAHYAIVQPFLALFFAFYLAIPLLYARRGSLAAKNPVDGLLVFGVPIAGFALQAKLVGDTRYGAAWSALALAGIYALLYWNLRKREESGFPLLSRAFLALATIFTTIAMPLALDNRTTAALWAVEATGVYWIGLRQKAKLARVFALAIEIAAGVVFAASPVATDDATLFVNAFFVGALFVALSGLGTAFLADRASADLTLGERKLIPAMYGWGALWWLGAGGFDLVRHLSRAAPSPAAEAHAVLAWAVASVLAAQLLRRWLPWPRLAAIGIVLLPMMAVAALVDFDSARTTLVAYGWLLWPAAWLTHWRMLRIADALPAASTTTSATLSILHDTLRVIHAVSAVLLVTQACWEASEWTARVTAAHTSWTACAAALPAIVFLGIAIRFRDGTRWPFVPYRHAYAIQAGAPIAGLLTLWFFLVNLLSPGDASPLPYWPIANPLDLTLALSLWVLWGWAARFTDLREAALYRWLGAALFVAMNGLVLRAAHHWGNIPWKMSALLASKPLQASLTITWTVTALAATYVATRRGLRPLWMLGFGLLALVVAKLFIVDLGALSGLPRVVAFLGAGALLLVIGYLAPVPPSLPAGKDGE